MANSDPDERKAYARRHYDANKATYKAKARQHTKSQRTRLREFILDYLSRHPCLDCGETDPIVLEFDHRDPGTKRFAIADVVARGVSVTTISAEIAKCDVRCANCHRRRTHRQRAAGEFGLPAEPMEVSLPLFAGD